MIVYIQVEVDDDVKNLTYFMLCADYLAEILPFWHDHDSNESTGVELWHVMMIVNTELSLKCRTGILVLSTVT